MVRGITWCLLKGGIIKKGFFDIIYALVKDVNCISIVLNMSKCLSLVHVL